MKELLGKIDSKEDKYIGKQYGEKRGRKRVLRGAKALAVARCAQVKKEMEVLIRHTPRSTGVARAQVSTRPLAKLVDKRAVYVVFKERPYDGEADPDNTWPSRPCLSRTAITEDVGVKRQGRTAWVLGLHHTSAWYFNNTAPPSSLARCLRKRSTKQQFHGSGVA